VWWTSADDQNTHYTLNFNVHPPFSHNNSIAYDFTNVQYIADIAMGSNWNYCFPNPVLRSNDQLIQLCSIPRGVAHAVRSSFCEYVRVSAL
jgi:hypothetical protein